MESRKEDGGGGRVERKEDGAWTVERMEEWAESRKGGGGGGE
jgi:hypothetical protein